MFLFAIRWIHGERVDSRRLMRVRGLFFWPLGSVRFLCWKQGPSLPASPSQARILVGRGLAYFQQALRVGRGRAGFARILLRADSGADGPWIGQGLLCKNSLRLDFNWCRFRRNRLGLFRHDRLRAGGWFVSFADDHQDEREQDCDTEDSAQTPMATFLDSNARATRASGGVGTSENTSSGGRASLP